MSHTLQYSPWLKFPLYWLFVLEFCLAEIAVEDKPLDLLDSILLPSQVDSESSKSHTTRDQKANDHHLPGYEGWPVYAQAAPNRRQNHFVSPLVAKELRETICPQVRCITFRNQTSERVQLGCRLDSDRLVNHEILDEVKCRYWKNPTTQTGMPGAGLDLIGPSTNDGRGFDLKIILSPNPQSDNNRAARELNEGSERRIQIDELSPGLLSWLIQTLRITLFMQKSPVHLTLSFIYIKKLRRVDLGDLSAQAHVTRLSLWNPFEWDEDSLIPFPTSPIEPSYTPSLIRTQVPPYFRLTIFCDHANRNPSFRRLWLPWKSWQVRFNHCHDLYVCRTWLSKYPVCDKQAQIDPSKPPAYMPSSFLMPKLPTLDMTTLSTLFRVPTPAARVRADNQILYENQCQMEPSPLDPLDDLKLDYEKSCWQPGAYQPQRIGDSLELILPGSEKSSTPTGNTGIHLTGSDRSTMSGNAMTDTNTIATTVTSSSSHVSTTEEIITPASVTTSTATITGSLAPIVELESNKFVNVLPDDSISVPSKMENNLSPVDITSSPTVGFRDLAKRNRITDIPQTTLVKKQVSTSHLTTAVIVLSVLVTALLMGVIFLVLWVRSRQRDRKRNAPQINGFIPYTDNSVYPGQHHRSQQWEIPVEKRPSTQEPNHRYATLGASSSMLLKLDNSTCTGKVRYNGVVVNGCEKTSRYGVTTKHNPNNSMYSISRPTVYGGVIPNGTDPTHGSLIFRPPLTPKQKLAERRRASHPSESPSLQRRQSSVTRLHKPEDEYRGTSAGQRTPGLDRSTHWLTSSQSSLHSRSRTRANDPGAVLNGRRLGSSPMLASHNVAVSDMIRLRPDQSPPVRMKKRKYSPMRQPKKQHTLVFEDGDLDEDKWPVGLRSSLRKL